MFVFTTTIDISYHYANGYANEATGGQKVTTASGLIIIALDLTDAAL